MRDWLQFILGKKSFAKINHLTVWLNARK